MGKIITVGSTVWTVPETVSLFDGTDVYIKGEGLPHADGEQMDCILSDGGIELIIEAPVLNGTVYFYLPERMGFGNDLKWTVNVIDYLTDETVTFRVGESGSGDFVPVFFYPNTMTGEASNYNINHVDSLLGNTQELNMSGLAPWVSNKMNDLLRNMALRVMAKLEFGEDITTKPLLISSPIPFKFIEVCPEMVHLFWKRGDTGSINNFWFHVKNYIHSKNELKTVRLPFTDGNHERSLYMPNIEIELTSGDHEAYILKELQSIGSAIWVKAVGWGVAKEDGYPVDVNLTRNDYSPIDNKMGAIEITMKQNFTKPANLII